ncbi:YVTN family beta-propeller protein [Luteibacter sp. Sphag1AF]|uniref:YncE family protein n=1 Tax=Luteibacter sp. Sphag1AF TaxID=2587031 RepID=UPI00161ED6A9|nr:YncE family protein [Luteibacter sp. Sphag1AF]MBB3227362.1 YVTN family beta-propeller protein [Luteibacter sp. Sphag1AF]
MRAPFRYLLPVGLLWMCAHAAAADAPLGVTSRWAIGQEGGWDYLNFDAVQHQLYVSRADRVLVLDVDSHTIKGVIAGTAGVHGIALSDDRHEGYTSNGKASSVTVFDRRTLKTLATIGGTGKNPDAIVYHPASHSLFTFNGASHDASVIDVTARKVVATIPLPGKPEFAVTDDHGHLFANIEDKAQLVDIDIASGKVAHIWSLAPCQSPSGLAIDKANERLFSVCDNKVMTVLDGTRGKVVASVAIGEGPDAVAFDAATRTAYVSDGQSADLTVVQQMDADHYAVLQTLATQTGARTLALDAQTHRLFLPAATADGSLPVGGKVRWKDGSFTLLTIGRP